MAITFVHQYLKDAARAEAQPPGKPLRGDAVPPAPAQ